MTLPETAEAGTLSAGDFDEASKETSLQKLNQRKQEPSANGRRGLRAEGEDIEESQAAEQGQKRAYDDDRSACAAGVGDVILRVG